MSKIDCLLKADFNASVPGLESNNVARSFRVLWKNYSNTFITLTQVIVDFASVFAAFWIGYWFYVHILGGYAPQTPSEYTLIASGGAALFVTVFKALDLYKREISLLNVEELRKILIASTWGSALFLGLTFYLRSFTLSRIATTISLAFVLLLVIVERMIFHRIHLYFHLRGFSQRRILIYGAGDVGRHLLKRLYQSPALGMSPVGLLDDDSAKHGGSLTFKEYPQVRGNKILGGFDDLCRIARAQAVEEVYIAMPGATYERIRAIVEECRRAGVVYSIVPHSFDLSIEKVSVLDIGGIPILRMRHHRKSWVYQILKRMVDFLAATILITLASPFYALFGILIKLDSPGPIIFKQKRVGLGGKEFSFYKFRTMFTDALAYAKTPSASNDPRITPVGRWLRRTSLDELPQLFNVLRGDMSLVGPRPEMPFIVKEYTPLQRERLSVRPGITGVWQISAVRGEPIHANLEYDLYYIENQSLLLDLVILVKTVFGVIRGIGAI